MVKHCTRCNKSIHSAWRTLDEKKFYHPHCFTCAVCNVILECVQECGVPNLTEVYCKKCYRECLRSEKISRWYESPKRTSSGKGQGEQLMQMQNMQSYQHSLHPASENTCSDIAALPPPPTFEQPMFPQTQTTLDVRFTSQSQYSQMKHSPEFSPYFYPVNNANHGIQEQVPPQGEVSFPDDGQYPVHQPPELSVMPNVLPPKPLSKKSSNKMTSTTSSQDIVRQPLKRQKSRIPRPTSAYATMSNKFLPTASALQRSSRASLKGKTKSLSNQLQASSSKMNTNRSRSSKTAISRSASMVQPRASRTSNISRVNAKTAQGNIKASKSFSRPPRSAFTEHSFDSHQVSSLKVSSKRQCAASFSNKINCNHQKVQTDQKDHRQNASSTLHYDDMAYFKHTQMESPGSQVASTILSREGSNVEKVPANRPQQDENNNYLQKYCSAGMNFDCPICLTPLLSCEGSNKKNARGNVVTICGHLFHRNCMENWLKSKGNKRCPICSSLCLLDTLQPVYLDCNVASDPATSKQVSRHPTNFVQANKNLAPNRNIDSAYLALKYEHEQLKRKYNAIVQEKTNYSLNVTIANNLQHAYDMECRNRLQLQWENKKLRQQIQELYRAINESKTQ